MPRVAEGGAIDIDLPVEVGGRPLQATGIHERVMELMTAVGTPKIHGTLHPRKIIERVKLGESIEEGGPPRLGIASSDVRDAFFGFPSPPRIMSDAVLRKAIARGVDESLFAYTSGSPTLGADGKYQVPLAKIAINRAISDDEIDLDNSLLMAPASIPVVVTAPAPSPTAGGTPEPTNGGEPNPPASPGQPTGASPGPVPRTAVRIRFPASRNDVFKSFQAIANLADRSDGGKIVVTVDGQSASGYEASWFRNAVQEPLDEADIDGMEIT